MAIVPGRVFFEAGYTSSVVLCLSVLVGLLRRRLGLQFLDCTFLRSGLSVCYFLVIVCLVGQCARLGFVMFSLGVRGNLVCAADAGFRRLFFLDVFKMVL